jgi:hypothetical protein
VIAFQPLPSRDFCVGTARWYVDLMSRDAFIVPCCADAPIIGIREIPINDGIHRRSRSMTLHSPVSDFFTSSLSQALGGAPICMILTRSKDSAAIWCTA